MADTDAATRVPPERSSREDGPVENVTGPPPQPEQVRSGDDVAPERGGRSDIDRVEPSRGDALTSDPVGDAGGTS